MGDLGRRGSRKRKDASQVSGVHPSLMLDPETLPVQTVRTISTNGHYLTTFWLQGSQHPLRPLLTQTV